MRDSQIKFFDPIKQSIFIDTAKTACFQRMSKTRNPSPYRLNFCPLLIPSNNLKNLYETIFN